MGQRMLRVNELVKREISEVLHTRYKAEAAGITVTEVTVAPDLRHARVFYSVLGKSAQQRRASGFLESESGEIRRRVGKRVTLKYLPRLDFVFDETQERASRLNQLLDELGLEEEEETDFGEEPE